MVQSIHIEVTKGHFVRLSWCLCEDSLCIGEYVVEEIVLDILSCQELCVIALDWEGLATSVSNPKNKAVRFD